MLSPQDWVWDAFSLYDSLFSFMHSFILRMNTKSRTFYAEPSKWKRFILVFKHYSPSRHFALGIKLVCGSEMESETTKCKNCTGCCGSCPFGTWSSCFVHLFCTLQVQRCTCTGHEQFAAATYCKNGYANER